MSGFVPLRILHVVESLDRGGLERMVIDLALRQARRGHQVRIAALYRPGVLAHELDAGPVALVDCRKQSLGSLRSWWRLRRLIASGADVVHAHNAMSHYYAVSAGLGRRAPASVVTRHGMGTPAGRASRAERLFDLSLGRTDAAVTVCDAALRSFLADRARARAQWLTIPNGIDLDRSIPRNAAARDALLATLGIGGAECLIGCVSRMTAVKRHDLLLLAFRRLLHEVPGAHLVLAGDGPLRGRLESLADELGIAASVHFLGARRDVPMLLAGLDVFALTSASEGYSLALLEAAAAGLPIVASDVGGNREIVRDGDTGLLFPEGDAHACAARLGRLARSPGTRERIGNAGQRWARAHASLDTMVIAYDDIYRTAAFRTAAAGAAVPRKPRRVTP